MENKDFANRFVNPYNFIPLMGACRRSVPKIRKDDNYTGYFDCRIKLLTPLFIPNTSSSSRLLNEDEKKNNSSKKEKGYDFFSYDDWSREAPCNSWPPPPPAVPVIPGSELRGAVRSVYEAAFNGCMSSVSVDRVLSRRTNEAKKPGILKQEQEGWMIYPCKKAMLYVVDESVRNTDKRMGIPVPKNEYDQWKEGQEIWIKIQGDYMKNGRWSIGKVIEAYQIIDDNGVEKCDEMKQPERKELGDKGYVQGWLHKGEAFSKKHHESIFYDCDTGIGKAVKDSHIVSLKKILKDYRDPRKNGMLAPKSNDWYSEYQVSHDGTLVYYSETANGHVYLSPACIGREIYAKTIEELLKNNGSYEPCVDEQLCPACQIFGMIGKSGEHGTYAYGSKVRVTDARLIHPVKDSRELFEEPIILPELGEPKPGAVEFYTKPPYTSLEKLKVGEGFWTYDYKHKVCNGEITTKKQLLSIKQPELRGRKYYWHSNVELEKYKETKQNKVSTMKQRIRPMKAGNLDGKPLFHFRIYFEQLSKQQLKELKWALDFGNADCAHKIGRAKPLGFGSVQIIADSLFLRKIDTKTGSWAVVNQNLEEFFEDSVKGNEALKIVQQMANWRKKPQNVRYPVKMEAGSSGNKPNSTASHQWFMQNKGTVSKPNFFKVLPNAKDDAANNPC